MQLKSSRRNFIKGITAAGIVGGLGLRSFDAFSAVSLMPSRTLTGSDFDLFIGETLLNITGKTRYAKTINAGLPGPLLRWKEGDTVTLRVKNRLSETTSIHWHGLILPANMDGVPGLSFHGIEPDETYVYSFQVKQNGTYWYHSHSGLQEQEGVYGPIIIDAAQPEPFVWDSEHIVMLTDWSDEKASDILAKLKKQSDYYNFAKPTVSDFFRDAREKGLGNTLADRKMWAEMKMNPTDLADVSGATYTYLMNGQGPGKNWTGLFRKGEKVRLRFINGSAMSYFDVRIPGLKITVVAADGQYVTPVSVDEFRIAAAETYDVIVEPVEDAYTIFAQSMDRSGYARGTLAVREGLSAPVPVPDPRPWLTMDDMGMGGMDHGSMDHSQMQSMDHGTMDHSQMQSMDHGAMDHSQMQNMDHGSMNPGQMQQHPASETDNPLVDMQAMMPTAKLSDPGIGLRNNGRKVLTYADLKSTFEDPDGREPSRTIELHLTGHMEKFAWSFNGIKFSDSEPVTLRYGERVRIVLVNDTMMTHPIHLHGMWSDLEDEQGNFLVRKHTIDMPPGSRRSYRVTADALGRWAYHCHLLFHMETGMFREVRVIE
ncbi:copper resistance system multicopper oxidase [Pantoea alhagi]|uniref:copper resistance system multicopper oxidase n=1 Tax=Pantoea alhagi TaxID=1891675 RepID=UPI00202B257D|nr:copper resistance system multicopper oxidase [Pantoea alhagi]URQ62288.1 copper resistance system multicopper oxidase [Pantoea alhagi]